MRAADAARGGRCARRSKRTLSSTSLNELMRQPTPSTLRWMRPPEMMQPWLTRCESVAMPTRACASSRKTNFAGGSCVTPVRIGQRIVVEVEERVDRDEVHLRLPVGVDRPDVAPVAAVVRRPRRARCSSRSRTRRRACPVATMRGRMSCPKSCLLVLDGGVFVELVRGASSVRKT